MLVALGWYTRKRPADYLWFLDRIAIPAALGAAFIRVGNFFNSEIVGVHTGGSWGVVFERIDLAPRHPVQLYEAVAYLAVFLLLTLMYRRSAGMLPAGRLTGTLLASAFLLRFFIEFLKTPQAAYEAEFAISVGQWLSVPFVIAGVVLIARGYSSQRRA